MVDFQEWFAAELEARHYSDRGFSELTGVSEAAVRTWRRGSSRPNWEQLPKIARALGVDVRFVRQMAGYRDEGEEDVPPISEQGLSDEEAALLQAFRIAGPEGRTALLATARVAMRFAGDSDQRYEEQQPRQRRVAEG
ncbi:MAG: helix-turn-helix domain-containing protein [Dehalococcoidia bacterium]